MGNSSSHTHEPLERGFTRGKFGDIKNGKSASFRFSKRSSPKKMDRLRRSFRDSFRRRKDRIPESSKPHQWQSDEQAVRSATCSFQVKYLGCVEVFESRGMQVCEEALKVLRSSRRRPIRGLLHVSGDGLRVVDDDTKGLIVDQTIEKVSFCAPDRNHERGFSYICRDGTTRRWMCHGFLAIKDSGERLSHAVGCAFAVCLERKQRRDKECGVTMTFDMKSSTFTRQGSFRAQTMTERLANGNGENGSDAIATATVPPQPKPYNPFAIERPHANPTMLERQGSFRVLGTIGTQSPFKRQMSLRINDLPSNAERQKAFLDAGGGVLTTPLRSVSPIPEVSPQKQEPQIDSVSQLCQELSQGLTLLSQVDDVLDDLNFNNAMSINQNISSNYEEKLSPRTPVSPIGTFSVICENRSTTPIVDSVRMTPPPDFFPISRNKDSPSDNEKHNYNNLATTSIVAPIQQQPKLSISVVEPIKQRIIPIEVVNPLPNPDQWIGNVLKSTSPQPTVKRPLLAIAGRAKSLMAGSTAPASGFGSRANDPFNHEWAADVARNKAQTSIDLPPHSTNPFISPKPPAQSFQVQL